MKQSLIQHFHETYLRVKERGAIWERGPRGWASHYYENAGEVFLQRFDESIRPIIKKGPGYGRSIVQQLKQLTEEINAERKV